MTFPQMAFLQGKDFMKEKYKAGMNNFAVLKIVSPLSLLCIFGP